MNSCIVFPKKANFQPSFVDKCPRSIVIQYNDTILKKIGLITFQIRYRDLRYGLHGKKQVHYSILFKQCGNKLNKTILGYSQIKYCVLRNIKRYKKQLVTNPLN